jgi:hypothetical protein
VLTACLLLATPLYAQIEASGTDVPWRRDQGAGSLTEPGPSRLLPPTDDASSPSVTTEASTSSFANPGRREPTGDAWWKEEASVGNPEEGFRRRGISPRGEIIQSTQILSMVGSEPILAGDLLGRINEVLRPLEGQASEDELDKQRWLLMERMLPAAIESKLVYLDFIRRLEKEQIDQIRLSVYEQFDERQLPTMVEAAQVQSTAELDQKMRALGSSLDSVRRSFFEQVAAREMIRKNGEDDSEVTHDELLEFYQAHADEYAIPAKARWEHMMVRFDNFKSKRDAYRAIVEMGNAVLRGAPFASVAQRQSQGPRSDQGGEYDWTQQGSLASTVMDDALFSLPVASMSDILEDEQGFHIVRVIERTPAGRVPFLEAQVGIREKIKEERRDKVVKEYLERLRQDTYVWNHFDDETQIADREKTLR